MKNSKKTTAVLTVDGQVLKQNPDGTYSPVSGQTDWNRVENMNDAEITLMAQSDPDNPEWTDEAWEQINQIDKPAKKDIHIKIDEDILQWFKSFGRGYQTRMNAVLRAFVKQNKTNQ